MHTFEGKHTRLDTPRQRDTFPIPEKWNGEPMVCGGCMHHGASEDEATVTPIYVTGMWVCPECNNCLV